MKTFQELLESIVDFLKVMPKDDTTANMYRRELNKISMGHTDATASRRNPYHPNEGNAYIGMLEELEKKVLDHFNNLENSGKSE